MIIKAHSLASLSQGKVRQNILLGPNLLKFQFNPGTVFKLRNKKIRQENSRLNCFRNAELHLKMTMVSLTTQLSMAKSLGMEHQMLRQSTLNTEANKVKIKENGLIEQKSSRKSLSFLKTKNLFSILILFKPFRSYLIAKRKEREMS